MSKGFTLLELIIVIGIIAVLAAISVLVLNPAQLFAQARDSQRTSDLASVNSAIALYLSTAATPTLGEQARSTVNAACGLGATGTCTVNSVYTIGGSGWVGVVLSDTQGGSPLGVLPRDPSDTANYQYAYQGDNTNKTFELNARLESVKFRDKMTTDGGNKNDCPTTFIETDCYYEIGTDPSLNL